MKPRNFPGKKNMRRIEAVERMKGNKKLSEAVENTVAKIVDQSAALATETKKWRGGNN